VHILVSRV